MVALDNDLEKGYTSHNNSSNELGNSPTVNDEGVTGIYSKDHSDGLGPNVMRVTTSSTGDIIYLGNQAFHRSELVNAFGGEFNPGLHPAPKRPMGNPVPLGLVGYSICTFTVGMIFLNARGVTNAQFMAAPALFLGGIMTAVAGFWCLVVENTFAATAVGAFGGFYLSYAGLLLDCFGVSKAYADSPGEYNSIMGFFLVGWTIYAFSMWLCTFKATWSFFLIIGFIWMYLLLLTISYFVDSNGLKKAAGVFAVLSSLFGFYAIYEGNATHQNSYIVTPQFYMPGAVTV